MKKIMLVLLVLAVGFIGCFDDQKYQVKYAIDLDNSIVANVTYKLGDTYKTVELNSDTWESESFEIDNDKFYYYIKLDSYASKGTFFVIVDNEVHDTSAIIADSRIENVFSGYIDMDGNELLNINLDF
jgi:hypothetical protein